jgi:hypothetical protein
MRRLLQIRVALRTKLWLSHKFGLAGGIALLCGSAIWTSAFAIVRRHDVDDARYRVSQASIPALADLPHEGHGELIAPSWVVTAAHAVSDMQSHPEERYVTINHKRRAVARIIVHPDYPAAASAWTEMFKPLLSRQQPFDAIAWKKQYDAAMSRMHDIALIELKAPVRDVSPMPYYSGSAETGQRAEIFGEGATGTDVTGAPDNAPHRGLLRRAENRIVSADGPWLRYVFDCGAEALPLEGVIGSGDSGGPVLIKVKGQWTLAGITHGLDGSLRDVQALEAGKFSQGLCGQTFASARLSYFADWIASNIHSVPSHRNRAH